MRSGFQWWPSARTRDPTAASDKPFDAAEVRAMNEEMRREPARSPELAEAWIALAAGHFDRVIAIASQFLDRPELLGIEATKLVGLAEFRKADYAASLPRMKRVAHATNNPDDLFNLCITATLAGDIRAGQVALTEAFAALARPGLNGPISVPQMRFYFAHALVQQREFALALEQIQELRKIYEQLRITDDTFVFPMLPHPMKLALSVFRGLGAEFPARQWISEFAARVDQEGAQYLREVSAQLEGAV
jgi:hypothetical protein